MTLAQLDKNYIWHPFTQEKNSKEQIIITKGEGIYLYDNNGKKYIDAISSWWTNLHGHACPEIVKAISDQASKIEHVLFASFSHEPALKLSEQIVNLLEDRKVSSQPLTRVFFSDNGSTSVEIALKMVYQYWQNKGQKKRKFIAFNKGYHGDTCGAMSVGKSSGFFKRFEDLLFEVDFLPFPATWLGDNDIEVKENNALVEIENYVCKYKHEIAGLIIEPLVQGAGGFNITRKSFLKSLMNICRENEILVIFDEVMTGFGRTGELFACKKAQILPDLICLSKGITGGFLPFATTVVREEIYEAFLGDSFEKAFAHGHSYTANPIGCTAALASLKLLVQQNTFEQFKMIEALHIDRLQKLFANNSLVKKPRVIGTIAAFDLDKDQAIYGGIFSDVIKKKFLEKGILIRPLGDVIYIMPPYCICQDELNHIYDVIEFILGDI
ncbi:MAG: adenosylmethionine--8-amino-7-oxononanoate transaminase [Pseudomonadota bacterium]